MLVRECQVHRILEQLHAPQALVRASLARVGELEQQRQVELAGAPGAARSPRARPRRASARHRGRRRGRWRSPAASAWRRRSGRRPSAAARRAARRSPRAPPRRPRSRARMPSACSTSVCPAAGQAHAARQALQQRHAGFGLQRRDLLGDGRLGVGERLGGRREGAVLRDLAQDLADDPTLSISTTYSTYN